MRFRNFMAIRNLFAGGLILLALCARLLPGARTIDDSFITFRYARSILNGQGFSYNPGQPVQGTTTPLYALLLAGLGAVTGGADRAPFPEVAMVVNAMADCATALLLWRLGKRLGAELPGAAAALVWAIAPFSVTFAIGGLETSLYVFLLTAMMVAYLSKHRVLTALAAAAALLTRPDALLLAGPLALERLYHAMRSSKEERLRWDELLACLLPIAIWGLYATLTFGSPIAHSVQAKLNAYRLEPVEGLVRLLQHYATPFLEDTWLGTTAIAIGLVLYPFLYILGARQALKIEKRIWPFVLYPWLYFVVFAAANPLIFRWYLTPPLPAYFLFILMGAFPLLNFAFTWRPKWVYVIPKVLLILLPLASSLSDWRLQADHGAPRPAPQMAYIQLELLYRQAAGRLAAQLKPGDLLAAGDVGVLGYYTGARILDTVGLNSPESLPYYPLDKSAFVINYAIPADLILDQRPDWVVILEVYGRNTLLKDERFLQQYTLWDTLDTAIYGSRGMVIYRRR
jgi:arabinofuranosyltransferase